MTEPIKSPGIFFNDDINQTNSSQFKIYNKIYNLMSFRSRPWLSETMEVKLFCCSYIFQLKLRVHPKAHAIGQVVHNDP